MRGITRTDRLVRLVMWAALVAAAWILFAPGKASASESPVQDVVRSATSLTDAVLDVAPQQPAEGSSPVEQGTGSHAGSVPPGGSAASADSAAVPPKAAPHKAAATATEVARSVRKVLVHKGTHPAGSQPLTSVTEPALQPVAATTRAVEPLASTATQSVKTVVDGTVDVVRAVDATIEPVPVLAPVVQDVTDLLVGVVDTLPVVGAEPVVELPLPGLPTTSEPSPTSPSPVPGATAPAAAPNGPHSRSGGSVTPRRLRGSAAAAGAPLGAAVQPSVSSLAGPVAEHAPRAGAEVPAQMRPTETPPWPTEGPMPAVPAPAPSSASSAGQSSGLDAQADVHPMTSLRVAGSAAIATTDMRAPDALNAQPGLRPD